MESLGQPDRQFQGFKVCVRACVCETEWACMRVTSCIIYHTVTVNECTDIYSHAVSMKWTI